MAWWSPQVPYAAMLEASLAACARTMQVKRALKLLRNSVAKGSQTGGVLQSYLVAAGDPWTFAGIAIGFMANKGSYWHSKW